MRKLCTGHQATRGEQLMLKQLVPVRSDCDIIVIHHVTDTVRHLQLEVERRDPIHGIDFIRVIL